jgi:hypothetical protein
MLNADQERHWPAFEQAMQDLQKMRLDRRQKMREARRQRREARNDDNRDFRDGRDKQDMREGRGQRPPRSNPAERMRERATRLSENGAVLKRLADALEPLYSSLNDEQKRRFAVLSRGGGQRGWHRRGRDGEPGMRRGPRRGDGSSPEDRRRRNPSDERDQRRGELLDATPWSARAERMAFRNDVPGQVANAAAGRVLGVKAVGAKVFGAKVLGAVLPIEAAPVFTSKVIVSEPLLFGGKASLSGGQVSAGQGFGFSRKIEMGEPAAFGRKTEQSI